MLPINIRNIVRYYKRHAKTIKPSINADFVVKSGKKLAVCPMTVVFLAKNRVAEDNIKSFLDEHEGNIIQENSIRMGVTHDKIWDFIRGYDSASFRTDFENDGERQGADCYKALVKAGLV